MQLTNTLVNCLAIFLLTVTTFDVVAKQKFTTQIRSGIAEVALVNQKDIVLSTTSGLRLYKGEPYTGNVVSYYPSGQLAKLSSYQSGLRHGLLKQWFKHGELGFSAEYQAGILHGISQSWWGNGNKRSITLFEHGKINGDSFQWYSSGEIFKKMHYEKGKEVGLQQAWRRNGKLFSNYEYVNGRIFGLKRANMCVELEDENVFVQNEERRIE